MLMLILKNPDIMMLFRQLNKAINIRSLIGYVKILYIIGNFLLYQT